MSNLTELKENVKKAQREYYNTRYKEDGEYRDKVKSTMRGRYERKTKDCGICHRRLLKEADLCSKCIIGQVADLKRKYGKNLEKVLTDLCLNSKE